MAVTHSTLARNAATNAVTALIGTSGFLVFRITGSTVAAPSAAVATLPLSATAFGSSGAVVAGQAVANSISSDTNATGGTVAFATLQTAGGTVVIQCSVNTSGSDINMSPSLVIAAGSTVQCANLTYTALSQV